MFDQFDTWRFIGGIGLFLFAMIQLEVALKAFAGRPLRQFLKRQTGNAVQSVVVGAASTAIVQSSSLVGLMVLAFVGASIMSLTVAGSTRRCMKRVVSAAENGIRCTP